MGMELLADSVPEVSPEEVGPWQRSVGRSVEERW